MKEKFLKWLNQKSYSFKKLNPYYPRPGEKEHWEQSFNLKDKYSIGFEEGDTFRDEFYITGTDLFDAFEAGYNLSKQEKEIK